MDFDFPAELCFPYLITSLPFRTAGCCLQLKCSPTRRKNETANAQRIESSATSSVKFASLRACNPSECLSRKSACGPT